MTVHPQTGTGKRANNEERPKKGSQETELTDSGALL
jgi:hypothetical protein